MHAFFFIIKVYVANKLSNTVEKEEALTLGLSAAIQQKQENNKERDSINQSNNQPHRR